MRLLVIVISVAMMIGCFGGVVLASTTAVSGSGVSLHESGVIPSKVALGDSFTVPAADGGATVTVKSPDGVSLGDGVSYVASHLGNYTVTYSKDDVSYTYTINCYEEAEYFISVADNGAGIPTYIKLGEKFTLPAWSLAMYDEDNNLVEVSENVTTSWTLTGSARTETAGAEVTMESLGSQIVALSASFANSNKVYSKEFTVIVQSSFEDTKAPTLANIANMPSSASVNTCVTLPVATAEDNYDENVLITVSVTDPDGKPAKEVELNDSGYAVKELEANRAFDNDRVITFYPTKLGTYVVSYVATDDSGNKSSEHTYKITVSDKTGPVIVDVADDLIPTVWGLKSVENKAGVVKTGDDLTVEIPIPEVVDNYDKFNLNTLEDAWSGDVTMNVEIANPSVTVARWTSLTPSDIQSGKSINATTPASSTYNKYFKDDVDGVTISVNSKEQPVLRINFSDFYDGTTSDSKTKAGVTGNWTITFSFRDKANNGGYNNSQKVYTINVSDAAFVDDEAPEVEAPSLPDYLIVGGETDTYTVPSIVVSDNKDSRLTEVYKIYSLSASDYINVNGGEELKIVEAAGKYFFENSDDDRLELGDKIYFAYSATDDAGNVTELKNGDEDYSLNIYSTRDGFETSGITFDIVSNVQAGTANEQNVGGFTVSGIAQREFVGYELSIKDENGVSLDGVSSYFFFSKSGSDEALNVRNIKFNPANGGKYEINVRIIDANGNSYVYAQKITATKVSDTVVVGPNAASASWNAEGTARSSYMLQRKDFTVSGSSADEYVRVFKISGGKFSILGYEFTPIAQGGYTITEFYAKQAEAHGASFEASLTKNAVYGMTVTDSEKAVFEVDGKIPTYLAKTKTPENANRYEDGAYYITDSIIAYSANQNYEVTVTYTDPDGNQSTAKKVYEYVGSDSSKAKYSFKEEADYEFHGRFALILDDDGTYAITAKATDSNGSNTKEFTVKVGDIEAPQFNIDTTAMRATVGDKFEYRSIKDVVLGVSEVKSDITVTYRLVEPGSGSNEVSSVSGSAKLSKLTENSGVYTVGIDTEYVFEKSGDYTVEITLTDAAGNASVQKYTITVSTTTSTTPTSLTMLSTILIIVGILLIAGVVVYLIRFRKRRA